MKVVFAGPKSRRVKALANGAAWRHLGLGEAASFAVGQGFELTGGPQRFGRSEAVGVAGEVLGIAPPLWEKLAAAGTPDVQVLDIVLAVRGTMWPFRVLNPLAVFNPFDMVASTWIEKRWGKEAIALVYRTDVNEADLPPIFTCGDWALPRLMLRDDIAAWWDAHVSHEFIQILDVKDWPLLA